MLLCAENVDACQLFFGQLGGVFFGVCRWSVLSGGIGEFRCGIIFRIEDCIEEYDGAHTDERYNPQESDSQSEYTEEAPKHYAECEAKIIVVVFKMM